MTGTHDLVLATVVSQDEWAIRAQEVLSTSHASLRERTHRQGLRLVGEPAEDVEILAGGTRVRITLSADGAAPVPDPVD